MQILIHRIATALLAAAVVACSDRDEPTGPLTRSIAPNATRAERSVWASDPKLALLMVEVSGGELESPLRYDLLLKEGVSESPLPLPEGKGYEVNFRGFDADGRETHQGQASVEYVEADGKGEFGVALSPIGEKGDYVKLEVGFIGEHRLPKGSRISIEIDREEVEPGKSFRIQAHVLDENGKIVEIDPTGFHWFSDDPHLDTFDPARPTGPEDELTWLKWADRLKPHLGVTIGDLQLILFIPFVVVVDPVTEISAGNRVTCTLHLFGAIDCWGDRSEAMLGDGKIGRQPTECANVTTNDFYRCTPTRVTGGRFFSAVSVGGDHVCAIERVTGNAFCWGSNRSGQLGVTIPNGGLYLSEPTLAVTATSGTPVFRSISAGGSHSCGVTTANAVVCWGSNVNGQLGPAGGTAFTNPGGYASVTAGSDFTCALASGGQLECYGVGAYHPQTAVAFSAIGQGSTGNHACGIANVREVWCWGWNGSGQLGRGMIGMNTGNTASQVKLMGNFFHADLVATGMMHSCAIDGGNAFCWGSNSKGELGFGGFGSTFTSPARVSSPTGVTLTYSRLSAGAQHTCGVATNGGIFCWGLNDRGQLGIGETTTLSPGVATPTRVTGT